MSDATTAVDAAAKRVRRRRAGEDVSTDYDWHDPASHIRDHQTIVEPTSPAREAAVAGLVAACGRLVEAVGQMRPQDVPPDVLTAWDAALVGLLAEGLPDVPQQPD